ncbi:MAG: metallophosphoesterase [Thermodesulfovibrionia bacterium]|nr:metallophosphoesterase [Thermodesulfovibrionia bacterium]
MILLFFCTVFIAAHVHLFYKITDVFNFSTVETFLLSLILLFLAASPLSIHFFARGKGNQSRKVTLISHMWVALLIIFFSSAVSLDIYNLLIKISAPLFSEAYASIILSPAQILFVSLSVSIIFTAYGFFDAKKIRTERLTVKTTKLPNGLNRIRILQISDLHLGIILGKEMLDKVIKIIETEKPDLIVSTGDMLNAEMDHIDHLSGELNAIRPSLGKYAVLGNHESYSGLKHADKYISDAGFRLLRGEGVTVKDVINIAGVDDPAIDAMKPDREKKMLKESDMLSGFKTGLFTILLKHRPDIDKGSLGLFDLQLSGHTHKGQIFPVHFAIRTFYPYYAGYYKLAKGSALYTSRGTGTAGPPVRFLSPPEVTVIDIVNA